jgi:phosphoribosylglycinamide formyltransferase-1
MKRIVVLASGRGSNFRAVLSAIEDHRIAGAHIIALVSDRSGTGAEQIARDANIPVTLVDYSDKSKRASSDENLTKVISNLAPDCVLALGFMRILPEKLVLAFRHKIINVHPSLLPAFPGMNAQKQALEYGVRVTGATVHFVDTGVDTGPIILQSAVQVPARATLEEITDLIQTEEHRIVVQALDLFLKDQIQVDGRKVLIK